MYVKVNKQSLADALDKIFVTVSKSLKSIPGASAVRIVFKDNRLIFYGRSRNDSIMVSVPLEETNGTDCYFGVSCVDLKRLIDTFDSEEKSVLLIYDNTIIDGPIPLCVKYGLSMFNLWTLSPEHMSPIEDFASTKYSPLDLNEFLLGLRAVSYCMNPDKDAMNGTCVDDNYLAATDGLRLSIYRNTQLKLGDPNQKILIPPESVVRMLTIFRGSKGEIESYTLDNSTLTILKDKVCYRTRLGAAKFPPYESILPKDKAVTCSTQKKEVLASLGRITAMSNMVAATAKISIFPHRSEMEIFTKTDKGTVEDYMEIECDGPDVVFQMNPKFMTDTIKRLQGDMVVFSLRFNNKGALSGFVEISEGPHSNFLMPIKEV